MFFFFFFLLLTWSSIFIKVEFMVFDDVNIDQLASILSYKVSKFFSLNVVFWLVLILSFSKNMIMIFDSFKKKLSNWKANKLSFSGWLTIVNLSSLVSHYFTFSLSKALNNIIDWLEGIRKENNQKFNQVDRWGLDIIGFKRCYLSFLDIGWYRFLFIA